MTEPSPQPGGSESERAGRLGMLSADDEHLIARILAVNFKLPGAVVRGPARDGEPAKGLRRQVSAIGPCSIVECRRLTDERSRQRISKNAVNSRSNTRDD